IQAKSVDLVQLQCHTGGLQRQHPVPTHFGVVTYTAQEPIGDPGRTTRPARDLPSGLLLQRYLEQLRRTTQDLFQLFLLVEVHLRGEAETITQRCRQHPARVVAPTRVNGATSNGIAVAPGPLPTITSTRKSSIAT